MLVVATAGHVDHGKSTLVRALTGMEPDRWAEERRRGMTIDLGYAWTTLPGGDVVSFVDVPGHQRFLPNMLAGVGPVPAVMLVVAADEGWRRQSAEHLAAVDALGVRHGLLVVTRADLAEPAAATAEALVQIERTSLGRVPAVAVSGATGQGLDELRDALTALARGLPGPDGDAPVRLWVDRAFTVRGAGTVVTGTLPAGTLRVGDRFELAGRAVVVRGLQSLGEQRSEVAGVARVAVNLRGVDVPDVRRGDALLTPGAWRPTTTLDVRLDLPAADLPAELVLHLGSAAVPVRVRPLGARFARLRLARELPVAAGERALLRNPGEHRVACGLDVLDADPPRLVRRGAAAARADLLASGRPDLLTEVARRGGVRVGALPSLGLPEPGPSAQPGIRRVGDWLVTDASWCDWASRLEAAVRAHERARPLEPGLPEGSAMRTLALPDAALLPPLCAEAGLVRGMGRIRRPGFLLDLGAAESAVAAVERRLQASPFDAPEAPDLAAAGLGQRELAAAETAGRLLRLAGEVVLLPDGPARAMRVLAGLSPPFTVSEARQALGISRRVAVPLLEHLDQRGWTVRLEGGRRVR